MLNIELLRADHVGLLDAAAPFTPGIDAFFRRGIIFEDASSGSGATYLSATAVATATETLFNDHSYEYLCLGVNQAVKEEGKRTIDRLPTIAEVLRNHGYHTVALNEWIHTGREVYLDRGFTQFVQLPVVPGWTGETRGVMLFEEQVDWIVRRLDSLAERPFFLSFHTNALHFPLRYPLDRLEGDEPYTRLLGTMGTRTDRFHSLHPKDIRGAITGHRLYRNVVLTEDQERDMRHAARLAFGRQVAYVDEELARIFTALRDHDLLDSTIVVLYANHGVGLMDHGIMNMGVAYQSCVHVPLLIRHPGLEGAVRVTRPVALVDLAPTLYDLLGIVPDPAPMTHSLLPLVEGRTYPREYLLGRDIQTEYVRRGHWKLIITGSRDRELYHLGKDPGERINRYDPDLPVVRELEAALRTRKLAIARQREVMAKQVPERP
jgi:arylsulfatase A-like enzyme